MKFELINYKKLNSRQKERYNFQKISSLLADYGYACIKLDDDWQSADFLAQHIDGRFYKVQLKGRLTFNKKYQDKDIYIAFPYKNDWFLFNHDELLTVFKTNNENINFINTSSWTKGSYSWNKLSKQMLKILEPFKVPDTNKKALEF